MTNPVTNFHLDQEVVIEGRGGGWDGVLARVAREPQESDPYVFLEYLSEPPIRFTDGDWSPEYLKPWSKVQAFEAWSKVQALEADKARLMVQIEDRERAYEDVSRAARARRTALHNERERTAALIREKTALEVEVEDLKATVHEASEQISRGTASFDRLKDTANKEIDRLLAEIKAFDEVRQRDHATLQELYREVNEAHAALDYAFTKLLNQRQRNRLSGFRDGYAQRCLDVPTPEH